MNERRLHLHPPVGGGLLEDVDLRRPYMHVDRRVGARDERQRAHARRHGLRNPGVARKAWLDLDEVVVPRVEP